jgi:two-component system, LuxR family, response regulator FixJ
MLQTLMSIPDGASSANMGCDGMDQDSDVVLVVDDDPAVLNALKFALEIEGLSVRTHNSAAELLADPMRFRCRCLVTDFRMPAVDGLELVECLRAEGMKAPVIMITGRTNKELAHRAAKVGIGQVLEKPLSDGALVEAIRCVAPHVRP